MKRVRRVPAGQIEIQHDAQPFLARRTAVSCWRLGPLVQWLLMAHACRYDCQFADESQTGETAGKLKLESSLRSTRRPTRIVKPQMTKGFKAPHYPLWSGVQNSTRSSAATAGPWDPRTRLVAVPLALIVIAAFIPALDNGFVNWDDDKNFLDNPFYRGLGLSPGEVGLELRSGSAFTNRWPGCSSRCNMSSGNSTLVVTT